MSKRYRIENFIANVCVPVLVFVSLFLRLMPQALSLFPSVLKAGKVLNVGLVLFAGFLFLKSLAIDAFSIAYYAFLLLRFLSSVLNGGNLVTAAWNMLLAFAFFLVLRWGAQKNWSAFIKIVSLYFIIVLCANLYFMAAEDPNGSFLDADKLPILLVGNRNVIGVYGFAGILSCYLWMEEESQKASIFWLLLWAVLTVTYLLNRSTTSVIGLALLGLYLVFFNIDQTRAFLNLYSFIFLLLAALFLLLFGNTNNVFVQKILGLLEKSSTFTNRSLVWRDYLEAVPDELLLGHGVLERKELARCFVGKYSADAAHAHNIFLNISFQTGLIGLASFITMMKASLNDRKRLKKEKTRYFIEAFIGVVLFISLFEAYCMEFYYLCLMVICFYINRSVGNE